MSDTQEDIERLWGVSELEQRVATAPDAASMRELADHYDVLGWADEARRLRANAADLPDKVEKAAEPARNAAPAAVEIDHRLKGRFTPRGLVEIIRVLHLTGKSGTLVAEAVGGLAATVLFVKGRCTWRSASRADVIILLPGPRSGENGIYRKTRRPWSQHLPRKWRRNNRRKNLLKWLVY